MASGKVSKIRPPRDPILKEIYDTIDNDPKLSMKSVSEKAGLSKDFLSRSRGCETMPLHGLRRVLLVLGKKIEVSNLFE